MAVRAVRRNVTVPSSTDVLLLDMTVCLALQDAEVARWQRNADHEQDGADGDGQAELGPRSCDQCGSPADGRRRGSGRRTNMEATTSRATSMTMS